MRKLALQLLPSLSRYDVCSALAINSAAFKQWDSRETDLWALALGDFITLSNSTTMHDAHRVANDQCQFTITLPNGVQDNTQGEHSLLQVLSAASVADVAL